MAEVFRKAAAHKGSSFVEVYQNCNIFNDGAFSHLTDKEIKDDNVLYLEDQAPLIFGKNKEKGIRLMGMEPEIVNATNAEIKDELTVFNENMDSTLFAHSLAQMAHKTGFPTPVGIFRRTEIACYEDVLQSQIDAEIKKKGNPSLEDLLRSGHTWRVE
jgi:2-oxoglutarate ferredoxin oxidoreductase subunit beta